MTSLREAGYLPYLVLEPWEESLFRERFTGKSRIGALDWPPSAQIGTAVRIYDVAARARYLAGEPLVPERIRVDFPARR